MRLAALRAITRKSLSERRDRATTYMVIIFPVMMLVLRIRHPRDVIQSQ
jgi:hypothetical protein